VSSLLVFNRVYRLEIQSVMLMFIGFVNYCPFSLAHLRPFPLPKVKIQYKQTECGWEGVRFARLAGSLTLKNKLSPEKYALLAPARRPALHFLWKIHIQGHLSSIHMWFEAIQAKQCKRSKTAKNIKQCKQNKTLQTSDRYLNGMGAFKFKLNLWTQSKAN